MRIGWGRRRCCAFSAARASATRPCLGAQGPSLHPRPKRPPPVVCWAGAGHVGGPLGALPASEGLRVLVSRKGWEARPACAGRVAAGLLSGVGPHWVRGDLVGQEVTESEGAHLVARGVTGSGCRGLHAAQGLTPLGSTPEHGSPRVTCGKEVGGQACVPKPQAGRRSD